MKQLLGTMAALCISIASISQTAKFTVTGKVVDEKTQKPVQNATIKLNNTVFIADETGTFKLSKISKGEHELVISSIGYKEKTEKITVDKTGSFTFSLVSTELFLQPLEVKATRAGDKAPFVKTNIGKDQIAKTNLGQDLPFLLNQTPSVVVNSDAGTGVGYTGIHIRGSDGTRINVTLNGIPYNDAESQGSYFVDLPDFTSSVSSIQIQRGVGTSSNGTGAFGATINLSTNEFNEKAYGEFNNTYGSFNTWKNTVKAGTGLIDGHFTVDARLSKITSDGYIDRASSDLRSFALSAAYVDKNSSLRFNIFSGKEKTYQAWNGVPGNLLATDRTYNSCGTEKPGTPYDNQTDNYQQDHYQLFYNLQISSKWSFNTALFMSYGRGYYEEYKAAQNYSDYGLPPVKIGNTTLDSTDLVRQRWLDNHYYGQIISLQYKNNKEEVTIGGGWTRYTGTHFGNVQWAQFGGIDKGYQYYDYPALKTDENVYAKWQHKFSPNWQSFVDVQYRRVYHRMTGFEGSPALDISRSFNFVNPKAGITYTKNGWQAYLSYAMGNKEPNRDDFQASLSNQPKAEQLNDFELGLEKKTSRYNFGANIYYMLYKNQLVLTGQINDVGAYTRTNVPNSYRLGLELQGGYVFTNRINVSGNITFSRNKVKSYTEYLDNWDNGLQNAVQHANTDISFSPSVIAGATVSVLPVKNIEIALLSKYVGKQYLDNAQDNRRSLSDFYVQDVRAAWTVKKFLFREWNIIGQVNNVFNRKYEPSGNTYAYIDHSATVVQNNYFPMAGTNYMIAVNIKF